MPTAAVEQLFCIRRLITGPNSTTRLCYKYLGRGGGGGGGAMGECCDFYYTVEHLFKDHPEKQAVMASERAVIDQKFIYEEV